MKKIYTLLFSSFCAFGLQAQTVLYTNNFDTPGSFTLDPAGSFNNWVINNVYQGGMLFSGANIPMCRVNQPVSAIPIKTICIHHHPWHLVALFN